MLHPQDKMVGAEFNLFPVQNLFNDPYRHLLLTAEEQIIFTAKVSFAENSAFCSLFAIYVLSCSEAGHNYRVFLIFQEMQTFWKQIQH